jgi:hypothetical protein
MALAEVRVCRVKDDYMDEIIDEIIDDYCIDHA